MRAAGVTGRAGAHPRGWRRRRSRARGAAAFPPSRCALHVTHCVRLQSKQQHNVPYLDNACDRARASADQPHTGAQVPPQINLLVPVVELFATRLLRCGGMAAATRPAACVPNSIAAEHDDAAIVETVEQVAKERRCRPAHMTVYAEFSRPAPPQRWH